MEKPSDAQNLSNFIKKQAQLLGFDDVGITEASGALPYAHYYEKALELGYLGPLDYLYKTKQARTNIFSIFPDAASVVVVVKNYYRGDHAPRDARFRAKIARYAWGGDYHSWFKKRLRRLHNLLSKEVGPHAKVWTFNDTGPFLERSWAQKAGLGFIGKSAMFIHRKMGTWTLLGGFATNVPLAYDAPVTQSFCGSCSRCMEACPTKAIVKPGSVDARLCISTWTIERPLKRESLDQSPLGQEWGFGCDICQEVCPWNKFQTISEEPRFHLIPGHDWVANAQIPSVLSGSPLARAKKLGLLLNFWRSQRKPSDKAFKKY